MNDKLNALNAYKKKLQTIGLAYTIGALLCVFLIFKFRTAGIILFFALAAFHVFIFKRMLRSYREQIKTAILTEGFRPFIKDISYQKKNALSPSEISAMRLLPAWHENSILVRDTIRGTYQAMPAVLTDLTTDFQSFAPNKNGIMKDTVDFLSGCLFELLLPNDSGEDYLLLPKDLFNAPTREHYFNTRKEHVFEEVAFIGDLANQYLLYISPEDDKPVIPKEFAKAILRLREFTPGQIIVQVSGSHLRIFIRNRFLYTSDLPLRAEITSRLLSSNPLPELPYMLRIADALLRP